MTGPASISPPNQGISTATRPSSAINPQTSINLSTPTQVPPTAAPILTSLNASSSSQTQNPPASAPNPQNKYRPLNVRDALSYLDQVKVQFHDSPGVYNKFLDIMKDFKTQMIDTPGVIDGVSSLFRGHPSLIQGFNTFLPPGYRIDVAQGDVNNQAGHSSAYSLITVTHPMGIQTQKRVPLQTGGEEIGSHVVPDPSTTVSAASASDKPARENFNPNNLNSPHHSNPRKAPTEPPSTMVVAPKPKPITLDVIANLNRNPSPAPPSNPSTDPSKPIIKPLEFNHAITYVNKIKNRYASDPKTYQTFLDILQTYQRDARPIQEVYEQVNQLFRGAPDLMAEFMQFLPDPSVNSTQHSAINPGAAPLSNPGGIPPIPIDCSQSSLSTSKRNPSDNFSSLPSDSKHVLSSQTGVSILNPDDSSRLSAQSLGKKRKHAVSSSQRQDAPISNDHLASDCSHPHRSLTEPGSNRAGEPNTELNSTGNSQHSNAGRGVKRKQRPANKISDFSPSAAPGSGLPPPGFAPPGCATMGEAYHAASTTNQLLDVGALEARNSSSNVHAIHPDSKRNFDIPSGIPRQSTAKEELLFFYHLKTYFENQATYIEFLKIINLFTQDLIDLKTLVHRTKPFLCSSPELFSRFKDIVGWKDEANLLANPCSTNGHLSKKKARRLPGPDSQPNLECEGVPECGPSYRFLTDSGSLSTCSGRDALCWDVLNDKLVCGAPTTNEDEQIFLPRQTNAFERALYQAEDERHEYDYHIEANVRTIALLEPINLRIQQMDPETRAEYRLKPGLGGQSKSVYQRIIKKIYGKQQGQEVIQALHDNPAVAVPIVLARLKQKNEEWKKALRDWNRVWREVDGKNYWKALDHQGISFKAIDKKMLANKNLINEIELIKREQQEKRKLLLNPSIIRFLPKHQLELELDSIDVFYDVLKVFINFLDYAPNSTGLDDAHKDRIEALLKSIVVSFFNIPIEEFEKHLTPLPPDRKGAENDSGNVGRNIDADGNETIYSEGDASDTAASALNLGADDSRPEGTVGRPSRGFSAGRKRGAPTKDGISNTAGASDLRKRAMKNASTGGALYSERASARRNETSKKGTGSRNSRATSPAEENAPARSVHPQEAAPNSNQSGLSSQLIKNGVKTSSIRCEKQSAEAAGRGLKASNLTEGSASTDSSSNISSSADKATTDVDLSNHSLRPRSHEENATINDRASKGRLSFFANNGHYCFFRLLHILYTRFKTLKLASTVLEPPSASSATDPGQVTTNGCVSVVTTPSTSHRHFTSYQQLMATIQNFNSGVLDQSAFEEECRNLFGIKGYLIVTVDKVCQALVKVLSKLSHHEGSRKIMELFQTQKKLHDSGQAMITDCQKLSHRRSVESLTGNGHESKVYRIEWISPIKAIRIQLIGGDEISPEDFDAIEKSWSDYIASFQDMSVDRTLGLENFKIKPPFLNRNIRLIKNLSNEKAKTEEGSRIKEENFITQTGLEIKICMRSYKMFYNPNTAELLMRKKKTKKSD